MCVLVLGGWGFVLHNRNENAQLHPGSKFTGLPKNPSERCIFREGGGPASMFSQADTFLCYVIAASHSHSEAVKLRDLSPTQRCVTSVTPSNHKHPLAVHKLRFHSGHFKTGSCSCSSKLSNDGHTLSSDMPATSIVGGAWADVAARSAASKSTTCPNTPQACGVCGLAPDQIGTFLDLKSGFI